LVAPVAAPLEDNFQLVQGGDFDARHVSDLDDDGEEVKGEDEREGEGKEDAGIKSEKKES
jgi:hypothetical protein